MTDLCDLYLRLSDPRIEGALDGREEKLRAEAKRIGWKVHRVIVENDETPGNGDGIRPASAFKRKRILTPKGQVQLRTVRPGFRDKLLPDIMGGVNLIAEDLDRMFRQPRDGEDLLDAIEMSGASARSLSGSLTLTRGGTEAERATVRIMAAVASKSSADNARRMKESRAQNKARSYPGGRRPFGYRPDPDSPRYHKRLIVVPEEAEVLQAAAEALLRGVSLKAVAADLRERRVPTVTGAPWKAETLRAILLNSTVTGLIDDEGRVVWEPIIPAEVQDQLRDLLDRDAREVFGYEHDKQTGKRTNRLVIDPKTGNPKVFKVARDKSAHGNVPHHLLSNIAVCGTCGEPVRATGGTPPFVCLHRARSHPAFDRPCG